MTDTAFDYDTLRADDTNRFGPDERATVPGEESYTKPSVSLLKDKERGPKAQRYEDQTRHLLGKAFRTLVAIPATVPDAAAITLYGEDIAKASGDLADADPRIAKALDFLTRQSDNPYAAFFGAVAPLIVQALRNHEPTVEKEPVKIRVPFTHGQRAWKLRFGVRLSLPIIRNQTYDPGQLTSYVFSDPAIQAEMDRQGIRVASARASKN